MKKVLAYIVAMIGWLAGIFLGTFWAMLYGGYQESNVIDLPTVLMENILPAVVSVYLANYLFQRFFPDNNGNTFYFHRKIVNILLIINYSFVLYEIFIYANYFDIIYVIVGLIYSGYYVINDKKIED